MKNRLSYFITKGFMFEIGFFTLFSLNGKNAWISIILGTFLGLIIIKIYDFLKRNLKEKKLIDLLKETFIGKLFIIIFIIFYIVLLTMILLTLSIFVNSFYLTNTPKYIIILPFVLLAYYLVTKDKNQLKSISNLLFFFSIGIVLLFSFLLIPYSNYTEFLPLFNYHATSIIEGAIFYAIISAVPQVLVIDNDYTFKEVLKNYLIASFINLFIVIGTVLALGEPLISIYKFPEYDVLKQIKILDFIENIENISAFGWYSELFILLSLVISNLKEALPKKNNNLLLIIILLVIVYLSSILFGDNYILTLSFIKYYPIILGVFFSLFILLYLYIIVKKNNT